MKDRFIIGLLTRNIVFLFIISAILGINLKFAFATGWYKTKIAKTCKYTRAPAIAVDENNVAHIVWTSGESNFNLYYANSNDNWLPIDITNTANSEIPSVFIDETNSVYIAWVDRRNGPNGDGTGWDVYYATSLDGWVNHLVTAGPTVACYQPSIAVDRAGDIHITFIRFTTTGGWPYNQQLFYTNKSSGWSETRISFTDYSRIYWSDMDIGNNGDVHVVFSNGVVAGDPSHTEHVWYANSADGWMNILIDSDISENFWDDRNHPSIDVDCNNSAHVVWEDRRNTALPGDPAYHGDIPNRKEVYYANSGDAWANAEIALPIDTTGPRVKSRPAIFVQNSLVHVSWIQREAYDWLYQENLFYGNSNNWDDAVNISNHCDCPIPDPAFPEDLIPAYTVFSSSNALSVGKNGISHVTWSELDNSNNTYKIFYASNAKPVVEVQIDIKPGSYINRINPLRKNKIPVAILSSANFDAATELDKESFTFGRTGDEESLAFCLNRFIDVNDDGFDDLLCHFNTQKAEFSCEDNEGILKGQTVDETSVQGSDAVRIVPSACR